MRDQFLLVLLVGIASCGGRSCTGGPDGEVSRSPTIRLESGRWSAVQVSVQVQTRGASDGHDIPLRHPIARYRLRVQRRGEQGWSEAPIEQVVLEEFKDDAAQHGAFQIATSTQPQLVAAPDGHALAFSADGRHWRYIALDVAGAENDLDLGYPRPLFCEHIVAGNVPDLWKAIPSTEWLVLRILAPARVHLRHPGTNAMAMSPVMDEYDSYSALRTTLENEFYPAFDYAGRHPQNARTAQALIDTLDSLYLGPAAELGFVWEQAAESVIRRNPAARQRLLDILQAGGLDNEHQALARSMLRPAPSL